MVPWIAVIGSEKRLHLQKHKEGDEKTDQTNVNGRILIMKFKGRFFCRVLKTSFKSFCQIRRSAYGAVNDCDMIRPILSDGKTSWMLKAIDP